MDVRLSKLNRLRGKFAFTRGDWRFAVDGLSDDDALPEAPEEASGELEESAPIPASYN